MKWGLKILSEEIPSPLQTIDLSKILFEHTSDNPPYKCQSFKDNAELSKLESMISKEHFYELESDSGKKLGCYQRDIGTYDEPEVEILTKEEWKALPHRPSRLSEISQEVSDAKHLEREAGIINYKHYSQWVQWGPEMTKKIPVPDLVVDYPFEKNEFVSNG